MFCRTLEKAEGREKELREKLKESSSTDKKKLNSRIKKLKRKILNMKLKLENQSKDSGDESPGNISLDKDCDNCETASGEISPENNTNDSIDTIVIPIISEMLD